MNIANIDFMITIEDDGWTSNNTVFCHLVNFFILMVKGIKFNRGIMDRVKAVPWRCFSQFTFLSLLR